MKYVTWGNGGDAYSGRTMKMRACVTLLALSLSAGAWGQYTGEASQSAVRADFVALDRNRDGYISKVKAALLAERGIPSLSISVETYEGGVLLKGFVNAADVVSRAGRITAGVAGVRTVSNNIGVR